MSTAATEGLGQAVCAEVKIEIRQKLSLERQAFDAQMRISNGLEGAAVEDLRVLLTFQDANGNGVTATSDPNATGATFFVGAPTLAGIGAIDGSGSVAAKSTAQINWLIVPSSGAGGALPQGKLYLIGAQVTYRLGSESKTVEVTPDTVTVKPQPLLELDYFLANDVYSDDPFTPPTEPPVPFTLGLRVKNVGGGVARAASIESAQPKIIENRQGLLIGFQILGGYVNDQAAAKSLHLTLGDIAPGGAKTARWNMVTTLSGRFVELEAEYTHADALGGAVTSLISEIRTHLLVHDVKVDLPGRDGVRDFLALDGDTVRVYESDGTDTVAVDHSANAQLTQVGSSHSLEFPATVGFAYLRLADPNGGRLAPSGALRSDGKRLLPENVWLSKTRNDDLSWSYYINVFDAATTGRYTVDWEGASALGSISAVAYRDANANGARDAGESGIGAVALNLTGSTDGGESVSVIGYSDSSGTVRFSDLPAGRYALRVGTVQGLLDGVATAGSAGGTVRAAAITDIVLQPGTNASGYLFAKQSASTATADLGLSASFEPATAKLGETVQLRIRGTNAGPSNAASVMIATRLPEGLALISSVAQGGSYNPATGTWALGELAAGGSASLDITARVSKLGSTTITADAASSTQDPVPSNNIAAATLTVHGGDSTLQIGLLSPAREADGEQPTPILMTVNNHGPDPAGDLAATISSSGVSVVSALPTKGAFDLTTGIWAIESLANGESAHLVLNVRGATPRASLLSALTRINGVAPATMIADSLSLNPTDCDCSDLAVTVTPSVTSAPLGGTIDWTVSVRNRGPNPALGAAVQFGIPGGIEVLGANATHGILDLALARWAIGTLYQEQSASLQLRTRVTSNTPGVMSILTSTTVEQGLTQLEIAPFDNGAVAQANVLGSSSQLRLAVNANRLRVAAGESFEVEWTLANEGQSSATGAVVLARLPAGVDFTSFAATQGVYDASSGYWNLGVLPAGGNASLRLIITARASQRFNFGGFAFSEQIDTIPADNTATLSVNRNNADIVLAMAADPPTVGLGQATKLTVRAANLGTDDGADIVVAVALPGGIRLLGVENVSGSFDQTTGRWRIGALPVGEQAVIELRVQLDQQGEARMLARLHESASHDPSADNNEAALTLSAVPQPALSATVRTDRASYFVGESVAVQVTVRNEGNARADNLSVDYRIHDSTGREVRSASQVVAGLEPGATIDLTKDFPTVVDSADNYTVVVQGADAGGAVLPAAIAQYTLALPAGVISGSVFDDANANGVRDLADPAIASVEIRLTGTSSAGVVDRRVTSNSAGDFEFAEVPPGTYALAATPLPGYVATATTIGSQGGIGSTSAISGIVLATGGDATGYMFAQRATASFNADLDLALTADQTQPLLGESVRIELVASNLGPAVATGTSATFTLPSGLTLISAEPQSGSYQDSSGTWSIGDLPVASSVRLVLVVRSTGVLPVSVNATVSSTAPDSAPGNNNAAVTLTPVAAADLGASLAASNAQPIQGGVFNLTATVTNGGPSNATGARLSILLPAGLTLSSSNPAVGSFDGASGVWSIGTLNANATANLVLSLRADSASPLSIGAAASSDLADPESANNRPELVVAPMASADLSLLAASSNLRPALGETVALSFEVANAGPSAAIGASSSIVLPSGLSLVSFSASSGHFDQGPGTWNLGSVAPGDTARLTLDARVVGAAVMIVAGSVGGATIDSNTANNAASLTINPVTSADLGVAITSSSLNPPQGGTLSLTVTVQNAGPATSVASAAIVLPAALSLRRAAAGFGSYHDASGVWTIGELANGAAATLTLDVAVQSSDGITVSASVSGTSFDPNSANNVASLALSPVASADLAIALGADNTRPNVGDTISLNLTATNAGPSAADAVMVQNVLPAGLLALGATSSVGSYDLASGAWTLGRLNTGVSATLAISARVATAGALTDTVTIFSSVADPNAGNNAASLVVNAGAVADLALTLVASNTQPKFGDTVSLTLSVRNGGPSGATGIEVDAQLPTGLALVGASTSSGSYDTVSGQWRPGDLANAGSATLNLNARVTSGAATTFNTRVTSSGEDPVAANNAASVTLNPIAADLGVVFSAENLSPGVNDTVNLRVELINRGLSTAAASKVTLRVPAGLAVLSGTASVGSFSKSSGVWTVGDLAANAGGVLTLSVRPSSAGSLVSTIEATSTVVDPNTANNTATLTLTAFARADLAVTLTPSNSKPKLGDTITVTVKANNFPGPQNATGVAVAGVLPAGLGLVSATPAGGTFDMASGIWQIGNLAKGATVSLQVRAQVRRVDAQSVTAVISGTTQDPVAGNNTAVLTISPQTAADLELSLAADDLAPQQTGMVAIQVRVGNLGPSVAGSVTARNILPAGLVFVAATESVGNYSSATGNWTIGDLPAGQSVSLTLHARVIGSSSIINTATVSGATFDANASNNSASITLVPRAAADLSLTLDASNATPAFGGTVVLTQRVNNGGPALATAVRVAAPLPAGLEFVSATASIGSYDNALGEWTIGDMSTGALATLKVTARVASAATMSVQASVASETYDANPANNSASLALNPPAAADLAVTLAASTTTPRYGEEFTLSVRIRNAGPAAGQSIQGLAVVPGGLTLVEALSDLGTYDAGTGRWHIPELAAGAEATLRLRLRAGTASALTLRSWASAATYDPVAANNNARLTIAPIPAADLGLTLSGNDLAPRQGSIVVLTLRATNTGPAAAAAVAVRSAWSSGLTLLSHSASAGSFDRGTGNWSIGTLAKDRSATLELTARVEASGSLSSSASISSPLPDPRDANNQAIQVLDASKREGAPKARIELAGEVFAPTRVLRWGACPALPNAPGVDCLERQQALLGDTLEVLGVDGILVSGVEQFREAMHCGDYNTYWLSGLGAGQVESLLPELAEAVAAGNGLILDGVAGSEALEPISGARFLGARAGTAEIRLGGGTFAPGVLRLDGTLELLEPTKGEPEGRIGEAEGEAAIVTHHSGFGRGVTTGFTLSDALGAPGQAAVAQEILRSTLEFVSPAAPAAYLPGERAAVRLRLRNLGLAAHTEVRITPPAGATLESSARNATWEGDQLVWRLQMIEGQIEPLVVGLRLPETAGGHGLGVSVASVEGGQRFPQGAMFIELPVLAAEDWLRGILEHLQHQQAASVERAVDGAPGARVILAKAQQHLRAGRLDDAANALRMAGETLARDRIAGHEIYRYGLLRLLKDLARQRCVAKTACEGGLGEGIRANGGGLTINTACRPGE